MSRTPEEEELLQEVDEADREQDGASGEEPYEEWEDDRQLAMLPKDAPRRVVVLEDGRQDAIFEGKELAVYTADADAPVKLPYFDPTGKTDEELRAKIKTYLLFS